MNNRTDWVDYAKAIGIILVVYGHVARGLNSSGIQIPKGIYTLIDSVIYSFHMPLFFFLSGLFFFHSLHKKGAKGLGISKIDTLIYPYILWSLIQGSIEVLLSNYTNGDTTFYEVLKLWDPRAQFWFLLVLFLTFVLCCYFFSILSSKFTITLFFISSFLYLTQIELESFKLVSLFVNNLVYFVLGIVFSQYKIFETFISNRTLMNNLILFIISQYIFHSQFGLYYDDKGIATLLLSFISISFIVSLSKAIAFARIPKKLLAHIGASSMAIYLMHIMAGNGARVILDKFLSIDSAFLHLIIGCFLGVFAPLLALKIIESTKIRYIFSAPISQWLLLLKKRN